MTSPVPEPVEIRHERSARRIVVLWEDGHESVFPLDYLRSWGPCATGQRHAPVPEYLTSMTKAPLRHSTNSSRPCASTGSGRTAGPAAKL